MRQKKSSKEDDCKLGNVAVNNAQCKIYKKNSLANVYEKWKAWLTSQCWLEPQDLPKLPNFNPVFGPFSQQNSLTCQNRKSTGGNDINDGCIPFRWDSSRALVACRLTHWHGLLGHRLKRNHCTLLSHVEFNDTSDILIICHSNISLFLMTLILHCALQIDFWMESPLTSPPTVLYLNGQWDRAGGALVWWGQWGKFRDWSILSVRACPSQHTRGWCWSVGGWLKCHSESLLDIGRAIR